MTTRVAVVGATGKMGTLIRELVEQTDGFEVVAALDSSSPLTEMDGADLVVDVTSPAVSPQVVQHAVERGLNVLVGSSGWSSTRITTLEAQVAQSVLATAFAAMAGRFYDSIEIIEAHRSSKVDSPSGTAVRTAELIQAARAGQGPVEAPHTDQRARGQQVSSIPIHSLRMRGVVAKQDVVFGGTGELLTISHDTLDPSAYERGIVIALEAARSAVGVTVGLDKLLDLDLSASRGSEVDAVIDDPAAGPENTSGQAAQAATPR
jgi:4-hydroxy-tetrahydrodipicolinate reductase